MNVFEGARGNFSDRQFGMKDACKNRDAIGETRTGAGEITIGIHREDGGISHGWNTAAFDEQRRIERFAGSARDAIAAGHGDDHVRAGSHQIIATDSDRRLARVSKHLYPS